MKYYVPKNKRHFQKTVVWDSQDMLILSAHDTLNCVIDISHTRHITSVYR